MADREEPKKTYHSPRIVHTEKITAHAVSCLKSDDATCAAGPIYS